MHHNFVIEDGILRLETYLEESDNHPIRISVQTIDQTTSFYKAYRNDCMKNIQDGYINESDPQEEFKKLHLHDLMKVIEFNPDKAIRYWENRLRDTMLDDIRIKDRVLVRRQVAD